jgi:Ti-type conjugative transfer relaxase TraA
MRVVAIFHLTVNIISRARGHSVVAAAAYRSCSTLRDERYGTTHYASRKRRVALSEIMAPPGAPAWVQDRETLWNRVEAAEGRKDSQLARLVEIGLPLELGCDAWADLVRDYVGRTFVARGMIADFCIREDQHNPQSHILLTLRSVTQSGFGPKERRWNGKAALLEWRAGWADRVNEHLARAGHAVQIDHRTLVAQQIELIPGRRIGIGRPRERRGELPSHLQDRIDEQRRIAHDNGEAILEDPCVALRALTQQRPTFTQDDLARFLRPRTDGPEQFEAVLRAVTASPDTVALDPDTLGPRRFTSRDMLEAAKSLRQRTESMAGRRGHGIPPERVAWDTRSAMSDQRRRACEYLISDGDAKALVLSSGAKAQVLETAHRAWEAEGWETAVAAACLIAGEGLETQSGLKPRTVVAWEDAWREGRDTLVRQSVLLIDGAETLGLKQLERFMAHADRARAKIGLLGDFDRMQKMRIETPFSEVLRKIGPPDAIS